MKKITSNILMASALSGLMFTSCDIERLPTGSMDSSQIENNPEVVIGNMVDGVYAQLKTWSDPMHRLGEYAGDNMMIRGTSTDAFYEFISFSRTPDNYRLQNFWDFGYKAIAQASNVIDVIDGLDTDKYNNSKGECYYVRGMMYFYLTRAFGRPYYQAPDKNLGVPIVNGTPSEDGIDDMKLPDRSTVKDSYRQAIEDLKKAEKLLTEDKGPAYASKKAAQAMLSRVYLYMTGSYENPVIGSKGENYADSVIHYSTQVIESMPDLSLREDYMRSNKTVPEVYKESIFVVKRLANEFSGDDYYYGIGGMYSNIGGMGWGEMYASAKYLDLLNETGRNDWRPDRTGGPKYVDARASFIEPQYVQDEKTGEYTEVLRFIVKDKDKNGNDTYIYKQLPVNEDYTSCEEVKEKENGDKETKTFTIIPNTDDGHKLEEQYYDITYNDVKYTGVIDYQISLNNGYPMFYIVKCSREDGLESQLHSPIISRLDEMYLNRAEAYVKKGNIAGAMADVNKIRARAIIGGEYNASNFTAQTAPDLVDKERQLELAYQAERSYDVFRNGGELERAYPGPHVASENIPATDFRVTYFIPQTAINSYPSGSKLTQNPTDNSGVILN